MRTFSQFLAERTFDISEDVDMIYDKFFKRFIDYFQKTGKILTFEENWAIFSSKVFESEDAKKAHDVNPVKIRIGLVNNNHYAPTRKRIELGFPNDIIELFEPDRDIEYIIKYIIDDSQAKMFRNEFTENKIKATISHELSHWIDDSLHSSYIHNMLKNVKNERENKDRDKVIKKIMTSKTNYIASSIYEINAQVHALKEMQKLLPDWDRLTFEQVIKDQPSFSFIRDFKTREDYNSWKKKLLKRLDREGILGKRMNLTNFTNIGFRF